MDEREYCLVAAVVNQGFADDVMRAAAKCGAYGGTIVNARGTGTGDQKKFFGAVIEPEKEMVLILTERSLRNSIMEAIVKDAGLSKEGMGICFSLPVDAAAGLRSE